MKNTKFTDFYTSYIYLQHHPIVIYKGENYFHKCLDIEVVKVNPLNYEISWVNSDLNTKTRIWLEFGPITNDTELGIIPSHDYDLDTGGDTFEEAIINLANLVYDKYKNG